MRAFLPCPFLLLAVGVTASSAGVEIVLKDRYLLEGTRVTLKGDLYYLEQKQGTLIVPAKLVREVRGLEPENVRAPEPPEQPVPGSNLGETAVPQETVVDSTALTRVEPPPPAERVAEVEPAVPAFTEEGMATWYGRRFHGRRTAAGETFDMNALTAAHASLPFGAVVAVTNLENGSKVTVRINDRLPSKPGLALNVSRAAAEELGMIDRGLSRVRIEAVQQ